MHSKHINHKLFQSSEYIANVLDDIYLSKINIDDDKDKKKEVSTLYNKEREDINIYWMHLRCIANVLVIDDSNEEDS